MAKVSIAAAGATAVKNELWMILDDLRRVYEETFLIIDRNESVQLFAAPCSKPSFFAFSKIRGVLISKYSSILSRISCVLSICISH